MKQATLYIDTSDSQVTLVKITHAGVTRVFEEKTGKTKSQNVLPLIEKSLVETGLKMSDLTGIEINTGPGSFTGVRVGVAVANALGWVLKIPVNGQKSVMPTYASSKFDE